MERLRLLRSQLGASPVPVPRGHLALGQLSVRLCAPLTLLPSVADLRAPHGARRSEPTAKPPGPRAGGGVKMTHGTGAVSSACRPAGEHV